MPDSADNICTQLSGGTVVGICALGEINPETFEVIEYLEGPRISGFTIRGFNDSGIIALATDRFHASHNRVEDNAGYGIFSILSTRPVLDHNKATGNKVFGNCAGILLLANAPGPVTNWKVRHTLVRTNNKEDCGEEEPVPSGVGILLWGASDNEVSKNLVAGNRGEEPFGGGIVLITAAPEEPDGLCD